jgi:hypothetical protein
MSVKHQRRDEDRRIPQNGRPGAAAPSPKTARASGSPGGDRRQRLDADNPRIKWEEKATEGAARRGSLQKRTNLPHDAQGHRFIRARASGGGFAILPANVCGPAAPELMPYRLKLQPRHTMIFGSERRPRPAPLLSPDATAPPNPAWPAWLRLYAILRPFPRARLTALHARTCRRQSRRIAAEGNGPCVLPRERASTHATRQGFLRDDAREGPGMAQDARRERRAPGRRAPAGGGLADGGLADGRLANGRPQAGAWPTGAWPTGARRRGPAGGDLAGGGRRPHARSGRQCGGAGPRPTS